MPNVRMDGGLGAIVSRDPWSLVAEGVEFAEGPVWSPGGYLLFSDIPNSTIHSVRDGVLGVYRQPSGQSNGLTFDAAGALIACEHEGRRVSRQLGDGPLESLASHYEGKRLNSPNDVVVRTDGRIYFTDPPYGIEETERELAFNGVYSIATDGTLTLLLNDFERPNGIALAPDERTLYIADTERRHVRAFDVAGDGALSNGRVFAEMLEDGRPDGLKVDAEGRLYVCARGVQVFAPNGALLGIIDCPARPANCAWGGDSSTLFVTMGQTVRCTKLATMGFAPHLGRR